MGNRTNAYLRRGYLTAAAVLAVFVLFTLLAVTVDMAAVPAKVVTADGWGRSDTETVRVGFSSLNVPVSDSLGYSDLWFSLSKYLGYLCILLGAACACVFAVQLVRTRSIRKVDHDAKAAVFLIALFVVFYLLFELLHVNNRPVIVDPAEWPEASYPSTHTLMGVMLAGGTGMFLQKRLGAGRGTAAAWAAGVLGALTVVTRLLSGVHWLTDILGGLLLGAASLLLFRTLLKAGQVNG